MFFRRLKKSSEPEVVSASQDDTNEGDKVRCDKRQLLTRHVAGDPNAFTELVTQYRAQIYSYLVRAGVEQAMRDDLFQEIFLAIHKAAKSFDAQYALNPWIYTIVVNKVRDHYRKAKNHKLEYTDNLPDRLHAEDVGHELAAAKQTSTFLENTIQKLSFDQREVILLHVVRGFDQAEVASILKIPVNTVKTHLRRGRAALTQALLEKESREVNEVQS